MKNRFTIPLLTATALISMAFAPKHKQAFHQVKWMVGAWQNKTPKGTSMEIWKQLDDSTLAGKSCFIKGNDTTIYETVSLQQRGNAIYYIPTVNGQNNGQPVSFKLTASTATKLVFENPEHDFPQKITYTQISKDSLVAEISGMIAGKMKAKQFPMKRLAR